MGKELARHIEVPEGVEVEISDDFTVTVAGPLGTVSRRLWHPGIEIRRVESGLVVDCDVARKRHRSMVGTLAAHLKNMITGVTDGFEYRMKAVYSHFPIQLKATGKEVLISNFLGERKPRSAKIMGASKVELKGDTLIVTGIDKESVGQTMANIEQATKVRGFDIRVFQDGIYLVEKR
ncbi:MAG: 50S ribosomal protein L6 [Methanothrix sp.]|jgi:large subunit ribosomal protein L6|nr:MAG: 50S ribosomal protein L6 [Methanothrix sp.]